MTEKESTSGAWRKRAVATVGVAAAVAAGSVALAGAANAATPATLTLTAPAKVLNTGAQSAPLTLKIDNTAGSAALVGTLSVAYTIPAGINCTSVVFGPTGSAPALVATPGTTGSCTATSASGTLAGAGASVTDTYNLTVTTTGATVTTGTLTTKFSVAPTSGNTAGSSSNTGTTAIVGPNAAAFASSIPDATVYKPYSVQVVTTQPLPTGTYTLHTFNKTYADDGTVTYGTDTTSNLTGTTNAIGDGFNFNATTGKLTRAESNDLDYQPPALYYIVANNGTGGATTTSTGTPGGSATVPTPATTAGDVVSPPFDLATLFSDVPETGTFSTAIYTLAEDEDIAGFLDGTFRPKTNVTREGLVQILFRDGAFGENSDGTCTTTSPSPFSDVSNNSQFCQAIRSLNSFGVLKGFSDGKFHPTAAITRGEISAVLYRFFQLETTGQSGPDAQCTSPTGFSDVSTSNVFCGDIEFLAQNKITLGYTDGTFRPKSPAAREAVAQFLYNLDNGDNNLARKMQAAK